mmetsp:Transcript_6858/g.14104  ORF Transcript_6858/g.14104 Transcript_6858/m.14104 type:complete len:81 (-) Transcript_6858:554-796(-)
MEREFFVSGSLWCIVLEGYILHRLNFDEALMLYKTLRKRDLVNPRLRHAFRSERNWGKSTGLLQNRDTDTKGDTSEVNKS